MDKNQISLTKFVKIGFLELSTGQKQSAGSGDLEHLGVFSNKQNGNTDLCFNVVRVGTVEKIMSAWCGYIWSFNEGGIVFTASRHYNGGSRPICNF